MNTLSRKVGANWLTNLRFLYFTLTKELPFIIYKRILFSEIWTPDPGWLKLCFNHSSNRVGSSYQGMGRVRGGTGPEFLRPGPKRI